MLRNYVDRSPVKPSRRYPGWRNNPDCAAMRLHPGYCLHIYARVGKGLPTYCISRIVGRQPFAANYFKT